MRAEILATLILLNGAVGAMGGAHVKPLETVAHVDLQRYVGEWHEIARYPNRFERDCDHNVTANYTMQSGGRIRVVNACVTAASKTKRTVGWAKVVDAATNAKLHVTFFWPFYGSYWVIDLDPDYRWAVVGEPSRKYLWILGRTTEMDAATYAGILARLKAKGYEPERLMRPKTSDR